jgi:hypothetical protein
MTLFCGIVFVIYYKNALVYRDRLADYTSWPKMRVINREAVAPRSLFAKLHHWFRGNNSFACFHGNMFATGSVNRVFEAGSEGISVYFCLDYLNSAAGCFTIDQPGAYHEHNSEEQSSHSFIHVCSNSDGQSILRRR